MFYTLAFRFFALSARLANIARIASGSLSSGSTGSDGCHLGCFDAHSKASANFSAVFLSDIVKLVKILEVAIAAPPSHKCSFPVTIIL